MSSSATRHQRSGIELALLAAALFGASTPLAKVLLSGTSPQVLAGLLYLGSGAGLVLVWVARRRRGGRAEAPIARRDLPWLAGATASGGVLAPALLMAGLARTPASTSSLLLNLESVFSAVLAWMIFRENVDRRIALGMGAIVAGGALLSWDGAVTLTGMRGPLLVAAACLGWAVDNNLTQRISASDPVEIAALKGLVAGAVNLSLGLAFGGALPKATGILGATAVGVLGYGVSLVLYVLAMRALGTARTGAYFSLAPFVGAAIGLVLFGEHLTPVFALAAGLMGLGLWLHLSERHLHDHQHSHLAHDPHGEPHTHRHEHARLVHSHPHYPDIHHRHVH